MPKTSDAMLKAINKYKREKVEEVRVTVPKGKKLLLQAHASERNESLNGFVNRAIDCQMGRDNQGQQYKGKRLRLKSRLRLGKDETMERDKGGESYAQA